jgi:hypothetical protein
MTTVASISSRKLLSKSEANSGSDFSSRVAKCKERLLEALQTLARWDVGRGVGQKAFDMTWIELTGVAEHTKLMDILDMCCLCGPNPSLVALS